MKQKKNKNNSKMFVVLGLIVLIVVGVILFTVLKPSDNESTNNDGNVVANQMGQKNNDGSVINGDENVVEIGTLTEIGTMEKVDIIDLNSKTRPYAVVVNNTAVAVKVQEGLNDAYLVYEIPTEGNTSRLLALYKDVDESLVIGTIRSARHDFVDFALESDAIFCCFGWSHYAEDDMKKGSIDYLQGLYGEPFYRNNPEDLALEHTAYTSVKKLNKAVESKKFRTTSDKSVLLNYNVSDVDLSTAGNVKKANFVKIPYGSAPQIASFKYDESTKMYTRYENDKKCVDHNTKEAVTTKNIIVQKLGYTMCDDNYYWDLYTIGSGDGYYITNGYAVPIKWSKDTRSAKTKYTYVAGTVINGENVGGKEISVSDGRTWIEVQTTKYSTTIE